MSKNLILTLFMVTALGAVCAQRSDITRVTSLAESWETRPDREGFSTQVNLFLENAATDFKKLDKAKKETFCKRFLDVMKRDFSVLKDTLIMTLVRQQSLPQEITQYFCTDLVSNVSRYKNETAAVKLALELLRSAFIHNKGSACSWYVKLVNNTERVPDEVFKVFSQFYHRFSPDQQVQLTNLFVARPKNARQLVDLLLRNFADISITQKIAYDGPTLSSSLQVYLSDQGIDNKDKTAFLRLLTKYELITPRQLIDNHDAWQSIPSFPGIFKKRVFPVDRLSNYFENNAEKFNALAHEKQGEILQKVKALMGADAAVFDRIGGLSDLCEQSPDVNSFFCNFYFLNMIYAKPHERTVALRILKPSCFGKDQDALNTYVRLVSESDMIGKEETVIEQEYEIFKTVYGNLERKAQERLRYCFARRATTAIQLVDLLAQAPGGGDLLTLGAPLKKHLLSKELSDKQKTDLLMFLVTKDIVSSGELLARADAWQSISGLKQALVDCANRPEATDEMRYLLLKAVNNPEHNEQLTLLAQKVAANNDEKDDFWTNIARAEALCEQGEYDKARNISDILRESLARFRPSSTRTDDVLLAQQDRFKALNVLLDKQRVEKDLSTEPPATEPVITPAPSIPQRTVADVPSSPLKPITPQPPAPRAESAARHQEALPPIPKPTQKKETAPQLVTDRLEPAPDSTSNADPAERSFVAPTILATICAVSLIARAGWGMSERLAAAQARVRAMPTRATKRRLRNLQIANGLLHTVHWGTLAAAIGLVGYQFAK